jgi:hypothetical protein
MQRLRLFCLLVAIAIAAGAILPSLRSPPSVEVGNVAQIAASSLDLGSLWESEEHVSTVTVENKEPTPVEVESVQTTCNCLSVEPQQFVLQPGERRELRLKIDLTAKSPQPSDLSLQLSLLLKAETSAGKQRGPEWTLRGNVRRVLTLTNNTHFGRISELAQPLQPLSIPVEVLTPLGSITAECDVPGFIPSLQVTKNVGKGSIQITAPSQLAVGSYQGFVTLRTVLPSGDPLPSRKVRFQVTVVSDLTADPPSIQVGGRHLGETFAETVIIHSLTNRSVPVIEAKGEGTGLTVQDEGGGRFLVRQTVNATGAQTNQVRFTEVIGGRTITLLVPVAYIGLGRN